EAIALTDDVLDVGNLSVSITERLTQCGDVDSQVSGRHDESAPDTGDQVAMAHDFAGVCDEHDQNVQRAISKRDRHTIAFELASRWRESERSEGCDTAVWAVHGIPLGGVGRLDGLRTFEAEAQE